jgi:hypothetical protein
VLWIGLGFAQRAHGTGFYGPNEYLSDGSRLAVTPEFYWDIEVQRLSHDFHPKEQPNIVPRDGMETDQPADTSPLEKATQDADAADFADALKTGRLKAVDAKTAVDQHTEARSTLMSMTASLPDESDSEFADYDRGADAYRIGKDHWAEAKKAWLALLARPAAERHYRTVWAAFMLGKLAMKSGDPTAVQWYEKTRQFAAQGFADSLGLAADSYGWEGRSEWKQGHPAKAAPLFLTQLALGDDSAIISLKALIPDRDAVDGMLNYDDDVSSSDSDQPGNQNSATPPPPDPKLNAALAVMAADPLLRRLETAHILATESGDVDFEDGKPGKLRSARWLAVIQSAHLSNVQDAEYLGWVAYTTGDYKEARHWLDVSGGKSPIAQWLHARLDLRAGDIRGAATHMAAAWVVMKDPSVYVGTDGTDLDDPSSAYIYRGEDPALTTAQWADGDMASIHLLRSDFVQALDTFFKGDLRSDAAYVAERVLTADELKGYVDHLPTPPAPAPKPDAPQYSIYDTQMDPTTWLRYLLGRRLVREDRYAEAGAYLPPAYSKLLAKYVVALKNGADGSLPKSVRADNWSTAAWLARFDGMEIMGTEVSPDGFDSAGDFEDSDIAGLRLSGTYSVYDSQGNTVSAKVAYPTSKPEKDRLKHDPIHPDVRYHYRIIATALALKAAALMDDNTEELADALNNAGGWSDERDAKLADHCYSLIEKRCGKSKLGAQILAKHWFTNQSGPWSTALQAQEDALHKQFGIVPEQQ